MRRDLDGDSRHEDPAERVSSEEPSNSRTTGGRQNSSSRVVASKTKFSMPDSAEIARMREEYLQNAPVYPCFPKRFQPFRVELYFLLEEPSSSASARVLSIVIFACIVLSIALFMLETMPELQAVPEEFWVASECFFTVVFLLEYLARLLAPLMKLPSDRKTPMNVVDVVAVLPFFVIVVLQSGQAIGFIRAVRLVRLFRIFKLGRYSTGLKMMMVALGNSGQALSVLVFFLGIGCVLFSSVVYHVEKLSCPDRARFNQTELATYLQECHVRRLSELGLCCNEFDAPVDFPSILSTFWWSIVTMTTVGYGDTVPRTNAGKVAGLDPFSARAYNMAVSSRGSPSLQVRRKAKEREDPPTKTISTRLRLLRFSNASMTRLARELAKELDEAATMRDDIRMFEKAEKQSQRQVLDCGITVVQRLQHYSDEALAVRHQKSEMDACPSPPEVSESLPVTPRGEDARLVPAGTRDMFQKSVTFEVSPSQGS
eukprot:s5316_g4.t1